MAMKVAYRYTDYASTNLLIPPWNAVQSRIDLQRRGLKNSEVRIREGTIVSCSPFFPYV